jgi:hypothetical protein
VSQHHLIDDIDEPEITAEYVTRRVDDWLRRLKNLFEQIKSWAATNGWTAEEGAPIPMHEELMERLGVSEREQPSLSIRHAEGAEIWIKPKGLWVIGANGRVDIYSRKGVFTLVDVAETFHSPQWVLHRVGKRDGQPFDPKQLQDMT